MQRRTVKLFISTAVVIAAVLPAVQSIIQAADEVTTKVVGFVKAEKSEGFRVYSIPFKEIGAETQIHPLNQDIDNDGDLDGFSEGIFSDQNFVIGDQIRKFNQQTGSFQAPAFFLNQNGVIGWYQQVPPIGLFALTTLAFEDGEGFLVKFASVPDNDSDIFLLGEVNDQIVETTIATGWNLLGNPFPKSLTPDQAFNDNDGIGFSPTAGTSPNPFNNGDIIKSGFNGSSWTKTIVYYNHPTLGKGWFEQVPPIGLLQPTTLVINPSEAYLYFSRNAFVWKQESPLQNE